MLKCTICLTLLLGASEPAERQYKQADDAVVERAARDFRIRTYEQYRLDRATYDARIEAGRQMVEQWLAAGEPVDNREEVVRWFNDAGHAQTVQSLPSLPYLPEKEIVSVEQPKAVQEQPAIETQIENQLPEQLINTEVPAELDLDPAQQDQPESSGQPAAEKRFSPSKLFQRLLSNGSKPESEQSEPVEQQVSEPQQQPVDQQPSEPQQPAEQPPVQ